MKSSIPRFSNSKEANVQMRDGEMVKYAKNVSRRYALVDPKVKQMVEKFGGKPELRIEVSRLARVDVRSFQYTPRIVEILSQGPRGERDFVGPLQSQSHLAQILDGSKE